MLLEFERVTFKCAFQDAIIRRKTNLCKEVISKLKLQTESNYVAKVVAQSTK